MFVTFLINAVLGAFIGFITNYLAIKMLFKPDKPVYIGRFRIPFTPGIIPKEKVRLAKSVGTVVGNKLLTGDVLEKALKDEDIASGMDKLITETVAGLQESQASIRDTLGLVISDRDQIDNIACNAIGNYLKAAVKSGEIKLVLKNYVKRIIAELTSKPFKDLENEVHFSDWINKGIGFLYSLLKNEEFVGKLELQIVHFIENGSNNASPLSRYLPDQFFDSVKNAISNNSDKIGEIVTGIMDNPQIEKNMLEILGGLMESSVTTRVINVFVSKDAVYKRIKQRIEKYVKSEKGRQELSRAINLHVDKLKTTSVGEIVKYANREDACHIVGNMVRLVAGNCLDAKFDDMLSNQIRQYVSDNPDITIDKILKALANNGEVAYGKFIDDTVELIISNHAEKWVDEIVFFAVPRLLDQKIARFAALFGEYGKGLGNSITRTLFSFILPKSGDIIKAMNIPKLITDKVNEYDISELEEIILSIIDRELKIIILLGAVFGFIIGLAGPLFSGLIT